MRTVRTLVTGATGRVGSRLVPRLAATRPLRVLVRDPERAGRFWDRGIDVVIGDLRDPDVIKEAVTGVDAVLHLAAAFRGVDEAETVEVNRDATVGLGRAALEAEVRRFVYASTTLVYGAGRGRPAHEDDEPAPGHPYPRSKAAAERALLDLHHDGGLGLRIVRLAFVYGDGDPHLAEWLPRAAAGPAAQRIQTVHHADVAEGLRLALETADRAATAVASSSAESADRAVSEVASASALKSGDADGLIFNLADDAALTAWELCALAGQPTPGGDGSVDPWAGIVDTRRIRTELGFRPTFPTVYAAHAAGAR